MRIVSRAELMRMPAGTVYAEYEPHTFHGLNVTGGGCGPDFLTCRLLDDFGSDSSDACGDIERLESGEEVSLTFGECCGREGLFDDTKRYAVWSAADLRGLAAFLEHCAAGGGPK
jgi:hypothetical protein